MSPMSLEKRVALITGASRGLGRALALGLADVGADVACAARDVEKLNAVADQVRGKGRQALTVQVDVANSGSVSAMVARVREEFGRIDVLINCAGVTWVSRVLETDDELWKWIIDTNLTGTFYCCREVAKLMVGQGYGRIINLASVAGTKGVPGLGAYAASKGGVIQLTKTLALELRRTKVRVNAIAPGFFRTDMNAAVFDDPEQGPRLLKRIPLARTGNPEELVPLAVWLASEQSDFVTGEIFYVSGGEMAQ